MKNKNITLSSDLETIKRFEDLSEKLNKNKSQLFREMVSYFYSRKDDIRSGIIVMEESS